MASIKKSTLFLYLIIFLFSILFVIKSSIIIRDVPFHDFDEAHRAENAKRMKEYGSFFVPVTGSPHDRIDHLKIPLKENPNLNLYYHLERPPLIYDLMIISISIFGNNEWAYRLPSFLLGMGIIAAFLFYANKEKEKNIFALSLGILVLITSKDLWLASQYAHMDTGITLFLFLSLMSMMTFCDKRKIFLIYLSGIFFGLALLSKLQPAVIFIFPLSFLYFAKKLSIKDVIKFITGFVVIFLPWVIYLIIGFGIEDVFNIMSGFALTSASIIDINQKAPFFWYIRWWWESFRPGWSLFLALLIYDIFRLNFSWKKLTLLTYIIGGLLAFSLPTNKIWWYVLPLVPAVSYFVFLSCKDYLKDSPQRIVNLSAVIIIASLPVFLQTTNRIALFYGILLTIVSCYILLYNNKLVKQLFLRGGYLIFYCAIIISLVSFYYQFPKIIPYHWDTKPVALYFKNLPGQKCLWIGDMPTENALFYSGAGEVLPIQTITHRGEFLKCGQNFLITPDEYSKGELVIRKGDMRLYKLNK